MLRPSDLAILVRAARPLGPTRWGFWCWPSRSSRAHSLAARGLVQVDYHLDRARNFVSITAQGLALLALLHPAANPLPAASQAAD